MASANTTKKISFASEEDVQHCYETSGANVVINVEPRTGKTRGSSMVKLKSIVGYKWKPKRYPGHLIAMHKDGQVVAYSFNVDNKGMIRVIHIESNKRVLIKGHTAEVFLDVQFSVSKDYNLAAIDKSSLYVFRIPCKDDEITYELLLKVLNPLDDHTPICDKISWCPYIPEFEKDDDGISSNLIVWSRANRFECFSVNRIVEHHSAGEHKFADLTEGIVMGYDDERAMITHVCFSPDGTTLCLSTEDGFLKFNQIYFHEPVSKKLATVSPDNGKKISSFFFLDDLTQRTGTLFWRYVVILFNDNSEIGVYDSTTWALLQSVKFKSTIGEELEFKAEIDRTSSYLIMSDMTNRQMYVMQIIKENALGAQQNGENKQQNGNDSSCKTVSRVFVSSIAEFNLASSILSYVISNASVKRNKNPFSDNFLIDEGEDFDDDNNSVFCVALKLYLVIPEGVQECHILYQPALGDSPETLPESPIVSELKTDVPPPAAQKSQINLLTPEAFSSPIEKQISATASLNASQKDVDKGVLSAIFMLAQTTPQAANFSRENIVNITDCNMIETEKIVQQKLGTTAENIAMMKSCAASGGSSPSREVRDILLQVSDVNDEYYPGEDSDDEKIEPEKTKEVLEALKSIDVDFKNIDEDDDDEDDYEEVSTTDDEIDSKAKPPTQTWPQVPQFIDPSGSGPATAKEVEALSARLNQMIEVMEGHSGYIAELREAIYSIRNCTQIQHNNMMTAQKESQKFIDDCKSAIESQLLISEHRQNDLIEKNFRMLENNSRNQVDVIEAAIRENITKMIASKPFTDHISAVVLHGLQKTLEHTLKKSLENLIPSCEKLTHEMMKDIGRVFSAGTKDYTRQFELHMKQYGVVQLQMNEFTNELHAIPAKTDEIMKNALVPIFTRHHFDLKAQMDKTEEKILREVRALVRNEIQKGFERQAANLEESVLSVVQRSHCETPAPIVDQKEQIRQQLALDEVNAAFHLALVSSDLSLLEFTIETADFNKVFDPCPLEQSVLLSLIQQLTAVMAKFNEIKLKYLSSAVMSLKEHDPIIKEHAPKILRELYATLNTFRQENPNNSLCANVKMIMFVSQQLVQAIE